MREAHAAIGIFLMGYLAANAVDVYKSVTEESFIMVCKVDEKDTVHKIIVSHDLTKNVNYMYEAETGEKVKVARPFLPGETCNLYARK